MECERLQAGRHHLQQRAHTSSITIVKKRATDGTRQYFEEAATGEYTALPSPTAASGGVLGYLRRFQAQASGPKAMRGLSPGTQKVLTLTEGERVRCGLTIGRDVVPCVTTLQDLPTGVKELTEAAFRRYYRAP